MQDWDDIRIFLAVSRAGSLNAAAQLVGCTQPTVSRRIQLFEKRLGVTLFARTQQGLALTDAGCSLRKRALIIEEQAHAINRQARQHDDRLAGVVRVSATEGLGAYWLTKRLAHLSSRHPQITLDVLLDNTAANLLRPDADVGLRLARPTTPQLIVRRVGQVKFGLYASQDYIEQYGAPREMADLSRHRLVTFSWDSDSSGDRWRDLLAGQVHTPYRSSSSIGQVHAVRAGFGLALLPTYIEEEYPDLVPALPDADWPRCDVWLVAHREIKVNARIRLVYDEIASQFALARRGGLQAAAGALKANGRSHSALPADVDA